MCISKLKVDTEKKSRSPPSSCTPTKEQSTLQGALKTPADIVRYFNEQRRVAALDYKSPIQYRTESGF